MLVRKAAIDAAFRKLLLDKRSAAALEIELELDPAEVGMLNAAPASQLEAVIARTNVSAKVRPAFLGKAAAVMLAALGAGTAGCRRQPAAGGARPDNPQTVIMLKDQLMQTDDRLRSLELELSRAKAEIAKTRLEDERRQVIEKRDTLMRHLEAIGEAPRAKAEAEEAAAEEEEEEDKPGE